MSRPNAHPRAWQRMLSGRRLDIINPSPLDIEIEDIALGLSRVARWNGQTIGDHGYSVAQHCVLVVSLMASLQPCLPPQALLAGLLHDAPEYVTSDLVTPFKRAVGHSYYELEEKVLRAVHLAFRLPPILPEEWQRAVVWADRTAAFVEAVRLAGFSEMEARSVFSHKGQLPAADVTPWPATKARQAFLNCFAELFATRSNDHPICLDAR